MRKIIIVVLVLVSGVGFSQSTIWADSLAKFEKVESRKEFNWFEDSLTETKQLNRIRGWYNLKVNVEIEARNNAREDSTYKELTRNQQKQLYIGHLIFHGYLGDNSLSDWQKLYNHPEFFGNNWSAQADYEYSVSTGIWYFINKWLIYRQALGE